MREDGGELDEGEVDVDKVREPVLVDGEAFVGVVDPDADRLGELEVRRPLDVDDRF